MIHEDLNYLVRIPLVPVSDRSSTEGLYQKYTRVKEILEWTDELTEWQPDAYQHQIDSLFTQLRIWFKDPEHATMCELRWGP